MNINNKQHPKVIRTNRGMAYTSGRIPGIWHDAAAETALAILPRGGKLFDKGDVLDVELDISMLGLSWAKRKIAQQVAGGTVLRAEAEIDTMVANELIKLQGEFSRGGIALAGFGLQIELFDSQLGRYPVPPTGPDALTIAEYSLDIDPAGNLPVVGGLLQGLESKLRESADIIIDNLGNSIERESVAA